jgi:y4mF family transcriptional regulator
MCTIVHMGVRVLRVQNPKDLGILIRDRRARLHWTQQDLADKAEVSLRWLVKVESGQLGAGIGAIMRVVAALGLTVYVEPPSQLPNQDETRTTTGLVDLDDLLAGYGQRPEGAQDDH